MLALKAQNLIALDPPPPPEPQPEPQPEPEPQPQPQPPQPPPPPGAPSEVSPRGGDGGASAGGGRGARAAAVEVGAAATQAMAELKERLQDIYDEAKSQELCDNGGGEHGGSQACALYVSSHLVSQSRSTYLTSSTTVYCDSTMFLLTMVLLTTAGPRGARGGGSDARGMGACAQRHAEGIEACSKRHSQLTRG